ncbi:MAG: glycosyltransferase family 4 protein [Vicinamibacteria bacterium]
MARASGELCRALAARGHAVTVATAQLDPADALEEDGAGVRVVRFPGPAALRRRLVPWARGLRAFLGATLRDVDVVHLHGHRNPLVWTASRAASRALVPCVLSPEGTFPDHGQRRIEKLVFDRLAGDAIVARADAVLAVSAAEARDLPRAAEIVPNGVVAPGVARPAATGARPPRVLFVGSDRPQKRAAALPRVLGQLPGVELDLVGPCAGALAAFGADARRVRALGVLSGDALATAYAEADVLLHPAVGEAFGLVPFEAALLGTASVVAGGHGCGEWFARAGGCVVPADDPDAMARAAAARLAAGALRDREARDVAAFARRELTWERAAEAVTGVYERALAARRDRRVAR